MGLITNQVPIESNFLASIVDNLNAEIVLGTVSNVAEACRWLSYTYLYVRMGRNPLAYGVTWDQVAMDPTLREARHRMIVSAAKELNGKWTRAT